MRCGACKFLRRKCSGEGDCLFAPHFPVEKIRRFACVHHVFGASNVSTILKFTDPPMRGMVAQSLAYQAEARVRDPVNGCVSLIMELEKTHCRLKNELSKAHKELAQYMNPQDISAMCPRYGYSVKVENVDSPMAEALVHLDSPSLPVKCEKCLEMKDPSPNVNVDRAVPSSSSSMHQPPQCQGQRGGKRKSIRHPSS